MATKKLQQIWSVHDLNCDPKNIVIGEAPRDHLDYYGSCRPLLKTVLVRSPLKLWIDGSISMSDLAPTRHLGTVDLNGEQSCSHQTFNQ